MRAGNLSGSLKGLAGLKKWTGKKKQYGKKRRRKKAKSTLLAGKKKKDQLQSILWRI